MQEIIGKIKIAQTDSDLEEISEDYGVDVADVFHLRNILYKRGTPCEGCKHIDMEKLYPCRECIRNRCGSTNYYIPEYDKKGF